MINIRDVADKADMIVCGYAFTQDGTNIRVLNLNKPDKAAVFNMNCELIETTMDEIESEIVYDYLCKNLKYMEE